MFKQGKKGYDTKWTKVVCLASVTIWVKGLPFVIQIEIFFMLTFIYLKGTVHMKGCGFTFKCSRFYAWFQQIDGKIKNGIRWEEVHNV